MKRRVILKVTALVVFSIISMILIAGCGKLDSNLRQRAESKNWKYQEASRYSVKILFKIIRGEGLGFLDKGEMPGLDPEDFEKIWGSKIDFFKGSCLMPKYHTESVEKAINKISSIESFEKKGDSFTVSVVNFDTLIAARTFYNMYKKMIKEAVVIDSIEREKKLNEFLEANPNKPTPKELKTPKDDELYGVRIEGKRVILGTKQSIKEFRKSFAGK